MGSEITSRAINNNWEYCREYRFFCVTGVGLVISIWRTGTNPNYILGKKGIINS